MDFEYHLSVRGYELDSYNHVNNAVYLNYFEQARWDIMKKTGLLEKFQKEELMMVVTDIHIRYSREACLFDNLMIKTNIKFSGPYVIFVHKMINTDSGIKISSSEVKLIPIDKTRTPCSIPEYFETLIHKYQKS
ncbi:MAG: thioesterase family protein [Bacteroidales bacterium]|jgi:acyl-CoA thioester hydrolase|nr:acyl-CoA thioesterase [Bacteroidales bacterium]MDD4213911.1 thioesterase family protein [Bacteroidales bacterium]